VSCSELLQDSQQTRWDCRSHSGAGNVLCKAVSFRVEDVVGQEAVHEAEEREFEIVMEKLRDRERRLSSLKSVGFRR